MNKLWFDLSVLSAKTAVTLMYVFVLYRLLGKRQVAQFNVYDLVTIVALANAVQNAMTMGKGDLVVGFVSSFTLILIGWLLTRLAYRSPLSHRVLYGTPSVILSDGHMLLDRMKREQVSVEELHTALRQHGLCEIGDASLAVLEVDGSISIVPKKDVPVGEVCDDDEPN